MLAGTALYVHLMVCMGLSLLIIRQALCVYGCMHIYTYNLTIDYGSLATNLWKTYFTMFELTEVMRQKNDQPYAELLNRVRVGCQTKEDMSILKKHQITYIESFKMSDIPHFFPTKDSIIAYNNTILEQSPGESITVISIDSPPTDITRSMQEQILIAARKKDVNSTGSTGTGNGAECYVRGIEDDPSNVNFPKYIWIEFTDIKIGQKLRRVSNHQYSSKIPKTWTPLSSVRRSFIVKHDERVTCRQFPLQLGAARTIHKAQSSTFGQIVVDMFTLKNPPRQFWEHVHYVAWSRCTSLDGLFIANINEEYICQSEEVRCYLSEDRKELELCYMPSYQVEDSIKIMYHNVCSISRKQGVIMNNQHVLGCDISILAETWLSSKNCVQNYQIPNFELWRMDSTAVKSHRGMIVHVRDDMCHVIMKQTQYLEICECKVPYKDQFLFVLGIYRPPSSSVSMFKKELFCHIETYDYDSPKIILGDFNINVEQEVNHSFLIEMKVRYNLTQYIKKSTTTAGTTIDLVFSNVGDIETQVITSTWSSHHILTVYIRN